MNSIYIIAAFLQAKELDRDVYLMPLKDIRREGYVWKLRKPFYGLYDASRKFWLKVKNLFADIGLKRLEGDEAVYFILNENRDMDGMVSTHVDDLELA